MYSKKTVIISLLITAIIYSVGLCDMLVPDYSTSCFSKGIVSVESHGDGFCGKVMGIPIKKVEKIDSQSVYLGGDAIGIKFYTGGVIIVGFSELEGGKKSPAQSAGLKIGDLIFKANGKKIETVEEFQEILKSTDKKLNVECKRNGEILTYEITPIKENDKLKIGAWIRDSSAGIGTVTFVTANGIFASLGHGINDVDTGLLMPLSKGSAVNIFINNSVKGKSNSPGELKGTFTGNKTGFLISNTESGLFGKFNGSYLNGRDKIELALKSEVHTGKAQIVSTVDGSGRKYYDVEIIKINSADSKSKNFTVKVTDPELIDKTGGIVQGMSGSPIIQDGKLVGAVTHVMISNPQRGYGIFIDNILENIPKIS